MNPRTSKNHRGFTLVELLVVIGIIAMLISMLLPALSRVKGQALQTTCASQMRDMGIALTLYSQTYRGWLFPVGEYVPPGSKRLAPPTVPAGTPDPVMEPQVPKTGGVAAPAVPAAPSGGGGSAAPAAAGFVSGGFFATLGIEPEWDKAYTSPPWNKDGQYYRGRFLRWPNYVFEPSRWNPRILICPADQEPAEQHTYILNRHLAARMDKIVKYHGPPPGRSPSQILVAGEKKTNVEDYYMGAKETDPNASEFDIVEPYRHGLKLGSNYLYMDGHVELLPPTAVENSMDAWDPGNSSTNPSP